MKKEFKLKLLSFLPQFIYKRIVSKLFTIEKEYSSMFDEATKNKHNVVDQLFDGDSQLFIEYLEKSKVYGEYGCGLSTVYAVNFANKSTISIDTDTIWVEKTIKAVNSNPILDISTANLGKVAIWGRPESYELRDNIKQYLNYIWSKNTKPDFVLVDGRFRVASFLTTLKNANKGTVVCFDDYVTRSFYHIVEEFEIPIKCKGRQAIFIVNKNYDVTKLDYFIEKFEFVFD